MHQIAVFIFLLTLPSSIWCCKGRKPTTPEHLCPPGFWEVPDGYRCIGQTHKMTDCAKDHKCMNCAYLCNGERNLMYDNDDHSIQYNLRNDSNYPNGTPDENYCTDEFCATPEVCGGRTKRCPGTTRCITPTKHHFSGTDIPIGPICSEVKSYLTKKSAKIINGIHK